MTFDLTVDVFPGGKSVTVQYTFYNIICVFSLLLKAPSAYECKHNVNNCGCFSAIRFLWCHLYHWCRYESQLRLITNINRNIHSTSNIYNIYPYPGLKWSDNDWHITSSVMRIAKCWLSSNISLTLPNQWKCLRSMKRWRWWKWWWRCGYCNAVFYYQWTFCKPVCLLSDTACLSSSWFCLSTCHMVECLRATIPLFLPLVVSACLYDYLVVLHNSLP